MSKLKLLILDANVVIQLHELDIWPRLVAKCEVHLSQTVVDESEFCDVDEERKYIDLKQDIEQNNVRVFDVPLEQIKRFRDQFDPSYAQGLDPGETESLAFLVTSVEEFLISSGDAIVYRVLGRLGKSDRGISLEEVLTRIGLQQNSLPWSCQKAFREKYTKQGEIDAIQGPGLKRSAH